MKIKSGQALVEYLVLVCLVGVAAIAIVSLVGKNLREQYANISAALRNERPVELSAPSPEQYGEKHLDDFAGTDD